MISEKRDVPEIVVMGASVIDLISYADRFPRPGETVTGKRFAKGFGGKSANQCIMAARLGVDAAMISKLGDDGFGMEYLENYRTAAINAEHVSVVKGEQTSTALISVITSGQNSIIYVPGAADCLGNGDLMKAEEMISSAKLFCLTNECHEDVLLTAVKIAKRHRVPILLNAAPVVESDRKEAYSHADILCLNETEAEAVTGIHVGEVDDSKEVLGVLLALGCKTAIVTLGSEGAMFASQENTVPTYVPARKVKPVDTTGAGDAFVGALAYYLVKHPGLEFAEKVRRACEIATVSVLSVGTQSSFPSKMDLPDELFL